MRTMRDRKREPVEWGIADQFARWTTRAAVNRRPGGATQYAVNAELDSLDFDRVFDRSLGAIEPKEFGDWHAESVRKLMNNEPALSYAWAAKNIAIYLKVTCYLAGFGRDGLKDVMHPPFDRPLLEAVVRQPPWNMKGGLVALKDIDEDSYHIIISMMKIRAKSLGCTLFEVEQLWSPPST